MRLLLDTHVFLWAAGGLENLSEQARDALADPENELFVSAAVAWEIAIKHARGKLTLPNDPATYVPATLAKLGATDLPITSGHALAAGTLRAIHADPFDRIMIAQAQLERLTLVTRDRFSASYPVKVLEA